MEPRDLEEVALTTWPALQQWLYDGWVVRFAAGYTKRANSVNPLYPALHDADAKIAQCQRWYAERQLPAVFRLNSSTAPASLDQALEARGYRIADPSLTLHRRLDTWALPTRLPGTLRREALDDWLAIYCQLSGKALDQQPAHAALLRILPTPNILAALWDGDHAVACAVGVISAQALSIVDVVTAPQQRRRGYGTALLAQLFAWAQHMGASDATLQVQGDNTAARALYARLGFQEAYHYWYRIREEK